MTIKRRIPRGSGDEQRAGLALRWLLLAALTLSLVLPSVAPRDTANAQAVVDFTATEITPELVLTVGTPLHPNPTIDTTPVPNGLPATSIARFDIRGVIKAIDGARQEWQIGAQPVFVYTRIGTSSPFGAQPGDVVSVVARRTLAPGPLVAESIILLKTGPEPLRNADVRLAFLFNGIVELAGAVIWRVGGHDFNVADPNNPTTIAPGLGVGDTVGVQFIVIGQTRVRSWSTLDLSIPSTQLFLDRVGQIKAAGAEIEIKGRQYEAMGAFPVTVNGAALTANEIKIVSNLRAKATAGEHKGTIDVDIPSLSGGHLTLEYQGTAMLSGFNITSGGKFKLTKATGAFNGLRAQGTYVMSITETGNTVGSPVTVSLSATGSESILPPPSSTAIGGPFVGGSGPGYPTGPLNMSIPSTQLLLDRVGEVKQQPGQLEVKDRQYEAMGSLPVTINSIAFAANEIKVISNLKVKGTTGEHRGTIDVDIDSVPGGHLTVEYQGTATIAGSSIVSQGKFKTIKTTDIFRGLVAEGTYNMTISESGSVLGSPAMVTVSTSSTGAAAAGSAAVGGPFIGGSGPGYPTGPLNMSVPSSHLILDRVGQVKDEPGKLEVKDRQYEGIGAFPVTINGSSFVANELKVISNLKVEPGRSQHQGTIDVDIDAIPGGHITVEYQGTPTVTGSTIVSQGKFKTTKATDIFKGLVAEGTYEMTIVESGAVLGSPATVTISTSSVGPAATAAPSSGAVGGPFTGGSGPGYPTGPLNITLASSQLSLDREGQVKESPGQLEIIGRQYLGVGAFPVAINGSTLAATQIKIVSNLLLKGGTGQHKGTVELDLNTVPASHITVEYLGTATKDGGNITSAGTFKTTRTTDTFAGLVADGNYQMTLLEAGATVGSPVTVNLTTKSNFPATTTPPPPPPPPPPTAPPVTPPPASGGGSTPPSVGPTGQLSMSFTNAILSLSRMGQVKDQAGQVIEIKDRKYEGVGAFPVTVNGVGQTASEISIGSSLMAIKSGVALHEGTMVVRVVGVGNLDLAFKGSAQISGGTIKSKGTFKMTKTGDNFMGLATAEGTYDLTIAEGGSTLGSPVTVSVSIATP